MFVFFKPQTQLDASLGQLALWNQSNESRISVFPFSGLETSGSAHRCLVSTVCFWRTNALQKHNVFDVYTLQVLTSSTWGSNSSLTHSWHYTVFYLRSMVLDLDVLIPVQVEEVKCLGVLFKSTGRVGHEIDRWIGMASTVMQMLNRSVVVKRELSIEAKLSINQSPYVPTLTYGHKLWECSRGYKWERWVSFEEWRGSVIQEGLGIELLLHVERSQLKWFRHLTRIPPGLTTNGECLQIIQLLPYKLQITTAITSSQACTLTPPDELEVSGLLCSDCCTHKLNPVKR